MRVLRLIKTILDRSLETLVAVVMGALVLDVSWQVFTRFVLGDPSAWTDELARYLLVWVSLLGAAVALRRGAHLGMDYFVEKMPMRLRRVVAVFGWLCVTAFCVTVLMVGGAQFVMHKLSTPEISPSLGLSMAYVFLALPISGFFLSLYSIELLVGSLRDLVKGVEPTSPESE